MKLLIADSSKETGALLQEYLNKLGSTSNTHVCYGLPSHKKPSLNNNCGADKIERMELMGRAGVRTVPWFRGTKIPTGFEFPALARKTHGHGGTDIVPVFQSTEVPWRVKAGWDWFSSYVPVANEYRVWVFRGNHLDTYEKVMNRPTDYKYIGRNFRNGFDFQLSKFYNDAYTMASRALTALGLDFGAVDMLRGEDGLIYILEVNTAPGVIASKAEKTLYKLATYITKWEADGYPSK